MRLLVLILLVTCLSGYAQKSENPSVKESEAAIKEKMPQFPGGNNAFYDYLDKNVILPEGFDAASYLKEHGNQYVPISVMFTIDVDGTIINVKVVDGENELLNDKAIQIVENMPKWDPGYRGGSPIKVQYGIPVRFNLM